MVLRPTWLQVPTFSKQVDTVDVTVRIFGRNTISRRSEFLCGDGSPPQIVWVFYWLMEHFLDFGVANAAGFEEGQPHPRNIEVSVKTINLNFVSGEPDLVPVNTEEQEEKWWVRQRSRSREARQPRSDSALLAAAEPLRMHPKWLAEFVGRDIASLPYMGKIPLGAIPWRDSCVFPIFTYTCILRHGPPKWAQYIRSLGNRVRHSVRDLLTICNRFLGYHGTPYGAIIHERIGCVKVYAEGELVNEVNPGAILAAMVEKPDQGSDWYSSGTFGHLGGDCRLLTFWNWKYQTVVQRQRLGLPLVGPLLWPALDELKGWRAARDEYRQSNNVSRQCNDRCLCRDRRLEEMLEKGVEPVNS
jgi:hypothetical protein